MLALVLLDLLVDDLVVAAETHVCAGHLASAEEGVHPATMDVGAVAQLDVATAAIAAQHVPAAPLWHRRHKHTNETNQFKIEEKRTQTNRFKIEEKRTFVSSVNKSTMTTLKTGGLRGRRQEGLAVEHRHVDPHVSHRFSMLGQAPPPPRFLPTPPWPRPPLPGHFPILALHCCFPLYWFLFHHVG
jgi:hypothetical protein